MTDVHRALDPEALAAPANLLELLDPVLESLPTAPSVN